MDQNAILIGIGVVIALALIVIPLSMIAHVLGEILSLAESV